MRSRVQFPVSLQQINNYVDFFLMSTNYYVYIIYSKAKDRYYIGHTHDIFQRVLQHNAGRTPSTKYGRPWILVYKEECSNKSEASIRELDIKSKKSRIYIEKLIKNGG
jgi:putative endonuclease